MVCFGSLPSHCAASKDQDLCVELGERGELEDAISSPPGCAHLRCKILCLALYLGLVSLGAMGSETVVLVHPTNQNRSRVPSFQNRSSRYLPETLDRPSDPSRFPTSSRGLENILHRLFFHLPGGAVQLFNLCRGELPPQRSEVLPRLRQSLDPNDRHGSLADAPVQGHLRHGLPSNRRDLGQC